MPNDRLMLIFLGLLLPLSVDSRVQGEEFEKAVKPLLQKYCIRCHGGEPDVKGDVNFVRLDSRAKIDASFELWESAIQLVSDAVMPPEDQPQPTLEERARLKAWYLERFVESVEPHPGFYRPRRLSAHEYRNTLHALLGFELRVAIREAEQTVAERSLVMKLLPTDPPGASGFKNDTSGNPLTTLHWQQYSYLVDNALAKLFSPRHRQALEAKTGKIEGPHLSGAQAEKLLRTFARGAARRPVDDATLAKPLSAVRGLVGDELETAVRTELKAMLMAPAFLYRGLLMDIPRDVIHPVDDFELAERLSYFLWGDMPDLELMRLAEQNRLGDPLVYRQQIDRMLASPRARNLAEDLGSQWFSLGEIEKVSNNPPVADALKSQPLDFLNYLFTEDRPLLELIDAETAFVNPHTAKYYPQDRGQLTKYKKQKGIEVEALQNQRIQLQHTPERGGLLTMPGILAMNRGPVLRGTWILERILGEHLPEPPADVGQVPASPPGQELTFRQRFQAHRNNPSCAVCHDKIDPLGFALQGYDSSGAFLKSKSYAAMRNKKRANKKNRDPYETTLEQLDTSGRLPAGDTFDDFEGLKQILVTTHRSRVIRNIVQRTLAYALCRKLEYYDRPTVEEIVEQLDQPDKTYKDLIHAIAGSLPFRQTWVPGE